jgi:hypothetical protein
VALGPAVFDRHIFLDGVARFPRVRERKLAAKSTSSFEDNVAPFSVAEFA